MDFLIDEVLSHVPAATQDFLLKTSVAQGEATSGARPPRPYGTNLDLTHSNANSMRRARYLTRSSTRPSSVSTSSTYHCEA